jgi:hypothetical protein
MANAIMVVQTDPADPSRADAFNDWLTSQHLPDVLRIPGFRAARRFRASEVRLTPDTPPPEREYLHFYELETDGSEEDLRRIADDLLAAIESGAAALSADLDLQVTTTYFYVPVGGTIAAATSSGAKR